MAHIFKLIKQAFSFGFLNIKTYINLCFIKCKYKDWNNISSRKFSDSLFKKYALELIDISKSTVTVCGIENIPNEPVVFVSNHQGNFDSMLILGYIDVPKRFIVKKEFEKKPIIKTYMNSSGCLYLDRDNPRNAIKTINEGIDVLNKGESIVIFPEGTRSKCSTMNEFKAGAFKLAVKSGAKIVPLTINNTYKVMEEKGLPLVPSNLELHIHSPIDTKDLSKDDLKNLHKHIEEIIKSKIIN